MIISIVHNTTIFIKNSIFILLLQDTGQGVMRVFCVQKMWTWIWDSDLYDLLRFRCIPKMEPVPVWPKSSIAPTDLIDWTQKKSMMGFQVMLLQRKRTTKSIETLIVCIMLQVKWAVWIIQISRPAFFPFSILSTINYVSYATFFFINDSDQNLK